MYFPHIVLNILPAFVYKYLHFLLLSLFEGELLELHLLLKVGHIFWGGGVFFFETIFFISFQIFH